jgi:predicted short-subunit dehydrogenase-like oxidoreductase (DUF2520 family)
MRFAVIGPGRAGLSLRAALVDRGWQAVRTLGRGDDLGAAAADVDVVFLAVPDRHIAAVAAEIRPGPAAVVHLSGAKTLEVLLPHDRRASLHPLVSLPDPTTGAARLVANAVFAVAGDPVAGHTVAALGGRAIEVPDEQRALYHATAAVAANHLVALAAQVERLAERAGVPATAYWELMDRTLDNVAAHGAAAALTGPAARGDRATIEAHLTAVGDHERSLYLALSDAAAELAGQDATRPGPVGQDQAAPEAQ